MAMIRLHMLQRGLSIIEEAYEMEAIQGAPWDSLWMYVVHDLFKLGLSGLEISELLRECQVWSSEARRIKSRGDSYDEIINYLITLNATWADIGRALMDAGLTLADTLRVVLPSMNVEGRWSLARELLLDGPDGADYYEAGGVVKFYVLSEDEALGKLEVEEEGEQRNKLAERLGLLN